MIRYLLLATALGLVPALVQAQEKVGGAEAPSFKSFLPPAPLSKAVPTMPVKPVPETAGTTVTEDATDGEPAKPHVVDILPDEGGGLWIIATDGIGRSFVRHCRSGRANPCSTWVAVDLGWKDRIDSARKLRGDDVSSLWK